MAEEYRYSTTNNTRRVNASIATSTKPRAYANETPHGRKRQYTAVAPKEPVRNVLPSPKKPRQTLNLLPHEGFSPAALARSARAKKGLATSGVLHGQPPTLEREIGKDTEMAGDTDSETAGDTEMAEDSEVEDRSETQDGYLDSNRDTTFLSCDNNSPASGSARLKLPAGDAASTASMMQTTPSTDPDDLATWNGMPVPPARAGDSGRTATPRLPEMRTSQGKVSYICVHGGESTTDALPPDCHGLLPRV